MQNIANNHFRCFGIFFRTGINHRSPCANCTTTNRTIELHCDTSPAQKLTSTNFFSHCTSFKFFVWFSSEDRFCAADWRQSYMTCASFGADAVCGNIEIRNKHILYANASNEPSQLQIGEKWICIRCRCSIRNRTQKCGRMWYEFAYTRAVREPRSRLVRGIWLSDQFSSE